MHKVFFNGEEVFNSLSLDECLGLGLTLHRASNVAHKVEILEADKDKPSITLVRVDKKD